MRHHTLLKTQFYIYRKIIREREYLSKPMETRPLSSLSGKRLDPDLENFSLTCLENFSDFISYVTENNLSSRKKYDPIFITEKIILIFQIKKKKILS